jgi:hypothetical protein
MRAPSDRGRGPRPSRAESEELLDGGGEGPLRELLAAVSAPAHREETVGEAAATSAFVAARHGDAPTQTVPATGSAAAGHRVRAAGWWRAPSRFVAALALALATAGVAVGAAAVVLRADPPAAPPASSIPAPAVGGAGTVGPDPLSDGIRIATCGAWRAAGAGPATDRAADPAFAGLISAAGGAANVDGYCAATSTPAAAPTTPGAAAEPRTTTSSSAPSARTPREGAAPGSGSPGSPGSGSPGSGSPGAGSPGADSPGASRGGAADRGDAGGGRSVGPSATPPGRTPDRNGPAAGRSVGPPSVPPGQGRAGRDDGATPSGEG